MAHEVITRDHPKIDRLACPWLIRRFIDESAEFIFVPDAEVKEKARQLGAIPFDVPDTEYIRKLRIEKALQLLDSPHHSLSEIAYLTGFSDQSHFTRIFKKHTGQNPSDYRKNRAKGKTDPKG